jgi:hypothetical protein
VIFDSITKYTIVENPHPPQGGVPLFIKFDIDLLFFLVSFVGYMSKPKIFEMLAFQNFGQ